MIWYMMTQESCPKYIHCWGSVAISSSVVHRHRGCSRGGEWGAWGLYLRTGAIDDGAPRSLGTATAHGTPSVGCNELGILTWGCCSDSYAHVILISVLHASVKCGVAHVAIATDITSWLQINTHVQCKLDPMTFSHLNTCHHAVICFVHTL